MNPLKRFIPVNLNCHSGLEPTGNVVGAPARFIIETIGAGKGEVEVIVHNPKGTVEKVCFQSF